MGDVVSLPGVCDLLDKLSKLDPEKVAAARAAAEAEIVKSAEPDPDLVNPREPNFVDGYEGFNLPAMRDALIAGENIGVSGPTGSGKSTLLFHVVDDLNESTRRHNRQVWDDNKKALKTGAKPDDLTPYRALPYQVEHMSCHAETRIAEIVGDVDLVYDEHGNRRAVVRWGHVLEAWTKGRILIAEEVDMPDPGVWAGTHQFFDGRTTETTVFVNGVQRVRKHPRFRLMATMNTLLKGENQEEYAGTQVQNTAWANRFGYMIVLGYMKPGPEADLLVAKTGIGKAVAAKMVAVADKSRDAHREGAVDAPITTRDLLAWAREVVRMEKRTSVKSTSPSHWAEVVVPSASPAFITRQPSAETQSAYRTYLNLRG